MSTFDSCEKTEKLVIKKAIKINRFESKFFIEQKNKKI